MPRTTPFNALAPSLDLHEQDKRRMLVLSRSLEARAHQAGPEAVVLVTLQQAVHLTPRTSNVYRRLAEAGLHVVSFAIGAQPDASPFEHVALDAGDPLSREWNIVVVGRRTAFALVSQEVNAASTAQDMDRRFRWAVTHEREAAVLAAHRLLHGGEQRAWRLPAAAY